MNSRFLLRWLLTLSLWVIPAAATNADPPSARVTILKAARLIDGTGAPTLSPAMILIEGERIVEIGSNLRIPAGARVIELKGAALLPGLIDLHTHLTGDERVHWEDALTKSTPARDALWGARNARITLLAGFTSCRDMGPAWPYVDVELRRAIEEGAVPGPRMLVAGAYVSSTGGAGDARQFSTYVDVPIVRNLADGPSEVTKAVRTNLKNGADFIKILATGAVFPREYRQGRSNIRMRNFVLQWWRQIAGANKSRRTHMAPRESRQQFAPVFEGAILSVPTGARKTPSIGIVQVDIRDLFLLRGGSLRHHSLRALM